MQITYLLGFLLIFVIILVILLGFYVYRERKRYQQSLGRSERLLKSIRSVYKIILEDLSVDKLLQKIVDNLFSELKMGNGFIGVIDEEEKILHKFSVSNSPEMLLLKQKLNIRFESLEIPLDQGNNPMANSLNEGRSLRVDNFSQIFSPFINSNQARVLQEGLGIKTILIYPLIIKLKKIGVFMIGLNKNPEQLIPQELDILADFAELTALVIDNSNLLGELRNSRQSYAQMTQTIYSMNAKLHQLDKLKDDFVSVASHELRTPMTSIRSYAWMALYRSDVTLSEKLKRYLTRTLTSTERLINLVNDMLNVSRIESGRIEIIPRAFDIKQLVDDVVAEVAPKASEKKINIKIDPNEVSQIIADPDKIHQVLLNLIGNSLKFTPESGIIEISFFSDGKSVETKVKDSGVGIAKEDMQRLFQKFGRLDNTYVAAATTGGTGLGLYISKSLIELMKGKIWANSEGLGKGAEFIFSLPVATKEALAELANYQIKPAKGEAKGLEPVAI